MSDSKLAQAVLEALDQRQKLQLGGLDPVQLAKSFEAVIRSVWPFTREWKYLCQQCEDYGLIISNCLGDATCGRKPGHGPHEFGTPCWCDKGKPFRPKKTREPEDALAAVGKTSKPSRWGAR